MRKRNHCRKMEEACLLVDPVRSLELDTATSMPEEERKREEHSLVEDVDAVQGCSREEREREDTGPQRRT
jgi:hypothetical protein